MTIHWLQHSAYQKELKALKKTFRTLEGDLEKVKKLLIAHFFIEATQGTVIHPGKIHRVSVDGDVSSRELWKVEVMVHGQRPSLWPRLWFMIDGENIAFLVIASHKTNYDNNEMDRIAKKRYLEMIDS